MSAIVGTLTARKFNLSGILPVSLTRICQCNNIDIFRTQLTGIVAYYMEQDYRRIIVVNEDTSRTRQRFSVAHEIGHVLLRHGAIRLMLDGYPTGRPVPQEIQANAFATELLMPKMILMRNGILTPQQIADMCDVSLEAATIRTKQLGWR